MKRDISSKNIGASLRQSLGKLKMKEIVEENKAEAIRFLDQTGEKLSQLIVNVNERFEVDLKQQLQEIFGKDFAQEAVLHKFDDFLVYLNRICRGPVKRFLGVHSFDKQLFKDVYKFDFAQSYGAKQIFYNQLLGQKDEGGNQDPHVNFQLSGSVELTCTAKDNYILSITIGDYVQFMTAATREITKKKLRHFLTVLQSVLEKISQFGGKQKISGFALKGMILFKKEDMTSSQILDYDFENDNGVTFVFEKYV